MSMRCRWSWWTKVQGHVRPCDDEGPGGAHTECIYIHRMHSCIPHSRCRCDVVGPGGQRSKDMSGHAMTKALVVLCGYDMIYYFLYCNYTFAINKYIYIYLSLSLYIYIYVYIHFLFQLSWWCTSRQGWLDHPLRRMVDHTLCSIANVMYCIFGNVIFLFRFCLFLREP